MIKTTPLKMITLASASLLLGACGSDSSADSEETNIGEQMDYTITGIEPGAGLTGMTRGSLEDYDSLSGWELQESSTAGMMTELQQAYENEEPIVVTGWTPHQMFEMYDLKFLDDPEMSFGEPEDIHTLARTGLQEDKPEAYAILDNYDWTIEDMQTVVSDAQEISYEEATQDWAENNQDVISEWTDGVDTVDGEAFELLSTPWDTERGSAHMIKLVLEQQGYNVTLTNVDPAILFKAMATGDGDGTVAAWLPNTHGAFMEEYSADFEDLGPNISGAVSGLVVPEYMDIDSIEDLPAAE